MAISPSIQVSQSAAIPANLTVTDNSSGTYDTITQRRIFVQNANGVYLTGDGTVNYTAWPLAGMSITLAILTQNTAANILVQWLDVSNTVISSYNNNYPLSQFGKQFFYYLLELQGLKPGIYQDANYSGNMALLWSNIIGGDNAVTYGNDIAAAQNSYNRATEMQNNENYYF